MANQVSNIIDDLDQFVEDTAKRITVNVTAELIEKTPIDTGWAQANWIPSVGEPFERDSPRPGVAFQIDTRAQFVPGLADRRQLQTTATAEVINYRLPEGQLFVTNNVPYIQLLDSGSSSQAPSNFVGIAISTVLVRITN